MSTATIDAKEGRRAYVVRCSHAYPVRWPQSFHDSIAGSP